MRISRRELLAAAGTAALLKSAMTYNDAGAASPIPGSTDQGASLQRSMIWASAPSPENTHFIAFRKSFRLSGRPHTARIDIFADARYILWINGNYVDRGPARFNPKGPEFDAIDVARYLKSGRNVISTVVMANASNGKMMLHAPGLTARLSTLDSTGHAAEIATDSSWLWSDRVRYRSPRVDWANIHDRIDSTVEDGDWTHPEYDDSRWKAAAPVDGALWGPLTHRRIPLLRETPVTGKLSDGQALPVSLSGGQKISFDCDRLSQAYVVLDIDADEGTTFSVAEADIQYTARAGRQTYLSSDTCALETATLIVGVGRVTIHSFHLVERLYPFDCVGSFHSNDSVLNRIWAMSARSVQLMSEDSYVDCADRERVEWMDNDPPAFEITRTAFAGKSDDGSVIYADPQLFEELLRRTALTLQPDGWVKAHTCSDRFDIHAYMEDRSCDWVEGARRYYESTGNLAPIREIWSAIAKQLEWLLDHRTTRGLVRAREWVVWTNPMGYQTCEGAGLNAFVYKALVDAAYLGGLIGAQEAPLFEKASQSLAAAFNTVLWSETDGTYYSGFFDKDDAHTTKLTIEDGLAEPTMFPALFALDQGIVPAGRRKQVESYMLTHRSEAVEVMTFYYLFKQMYAQQDPSLDREIVDTIRTRFQPMAETGWKTSWESFDGGSRAHIYGSFPGYFLSAYVAGVRRDEPVWKRRLVIEPRLGDLTHVAATIVTEFGPAPIQWNVGRGRLDFKFTVPEGVKVSLHIPKLGDPQDLVVDGKRLEAESAGAFIAVDLPGGQHDGTVTFHERGSGSGGP